MNQKIRHSLNPDTFLKHAKSTFLAGNECLLKFLELVQQSLYEEENSLKQIGFFRSTLLHYAITTELLLKALALHHERPNIESGEIKTLEN
ncbi:hypothetical protein [Cecembia lonarensis]|uniref:Uncharacterized protein n=1 Tax=Cecembia lonarensis (strain CCUG 58316 / KCTC 22772 / LW9) TaxID=1225176 RepID=K1KT15_CECL9|nr:hypothetical protein [Cecembia lonarensis]EKB47285.1 hypothetical protein B879_04121 [Cecembia lonarensis LW9]